MDSTVISTLAPVLRVAMGFLLIVSAMLFIQGGFRWATASGNDVRAAQAKRLITSAILCLVLALGAFVTATYIL